MTFHVIAKRPSTSPGPDSSVDVEDVNWIQPVVKTPAVRGDTTAGDERQGRRELKKTATRAEGEHRARRIIAGTTLKWFRQKWQRRMSKRFIAGLTNQSPRSTLPRSVSRRNTRTIGRRKSCEKKEKKTGEERERPPSYPLPNKSPFYDGDLWKPFRRFMSLIPATPRPPSTYTPGLHSIFPSLAAYKGRNCDHLSLTPRREDEFSGAET